MKSVIILLALVAFCHAAPLDVKESTSGELSRPSPISPDVLVDPKPTAKVVLLKDAPVLNRQRRNEPKKPDSVKAHEQLHHSQPAVPEHHEQKPSPAGPHDHKHKREAHHEEGHHGDDAVPQKEEVKQAPEAHEAKKEKREADHEEGHHGDDAAPHKEEVKQAPEAHEDKKEKREVHHEEGHKDEAGDRPQVEDLSLPHALPAVAHTAELPKKQEKRETVEKPDSVKARESLQHNPQRSEELHKAIESLVGGKAPEQRHQRDIPVPTQTKATTTDLPSTTKSELGSTTPSILNLHIPHPIPVAELFEKNKHADKSTSSSEESKEKAKA
ncbi:nucleolar protein 58 [Drosophila mauritiana]|uniref:Nucleolar protein 58 n=1 Tax=Drosophila mauritiana TaxID=7226 RepID=A0A6P8K7T4_DROMA|nr:nucleolar protein 58 [Drosophila mauritiana]